ncbi:MAG: DMT family transporter [Syntrophobacteraceae bacterium]
MYRFVGILFVAVSAVGFGTLAIFARYAYADGLSTSTILFIRFALATAVMLCLLISRRERLPHGIVLLELIGMGAVGYVGQAFCFLAALHYASSGLVALLLYLYPAFVAVLSAWLLREPITGIKIPALGLALAGTALTVGPEGGRWLGILLAILAAVIYSFYIIVGTRVMKQVSAIQSSTVIFGSAAAVSGILMAATGPQTPATGAGWAAIAGIVLVATVLPVSSFLAGLKRIGPNNAAMLSTLEPAVTVLLAALLLGETLKPIALLGGSMVLAAVLLLAYGELRRVQPKSSVKSTPVSQKASAPRPSASLSGK